jgi:hypothetical protein
MPKQKTHTMKKLFIALFLCWGLSYSLYCQQNSFSPIQDKWETDYQKTREYNYYNSDYCDYYLMFSGGNSLNITPGKNTIMRITESSKGDNTFSYPGTYRFYKGKFIDKFNPDFLYALPLHDGDSTQFKINSKQRDLTLMFSCKNTDTIYAVRGGIICMFDATDMSSKYANPHKENCLLIYHQDYTFAEYTGFTKTFVSPGDLVSVGQALGIVNVTNKVNPYKLSIAFFFLDKNKVTNKQTGNKYSHFAPLFHTANAGNIKLEEGKAYISQLSDTIITQEMSKREKKRYEKKKLKALEKK